jgi:hypothetical protein
LDRSGNIFLMRLLTRLHVISHQNMEDDYSVTQVLCYYVPGEALQTTCVRHRSESVHHGPLSTYSCQTLETHAVIRAQYFPSRTCPYPLGSACLWVCRGVGDAHCAAVAVAGGKPDAVHQMFSIRL